MLRQLNLVPLLLIPIATIAFVAREGIVKVGWLTPKERVVGAPVVEELSLSSAEVGQDYVVRVELPSDYATSGLTYPVIYAIHSQPTMMNYADIVSPVLARSRMPDVIVVGVSPANSMRQRGRIPRKNKDAVQWADTMTRILRIAADGVKSGGKAGDFLAFIESTVIPKIESTYRVKADDRCLAGYDLAGTFVLETMLARPELFRRYLAVAPDASWANGGFLERTRKELKPDFDPDVRLYLAIGDLDDSINMRCFKELVKILTSKRYTHMEIRSKIFPNQGRITVLNVAARDGLEFLYKGN